MSKISKKVSKGVFGGLGSLISLAGAAAAGLDRLQPQIYQP